MKQTLKPCSRAWTSKHLELCQFSQQTRGFRKLAGDRFRNSHGQNFTYEPQDRTHDEIIRSSACITTGGPGRCFGLCSPFNIENGLRRSIDTWAICPSGPKFSLNIRCQGHARVTGGLLLSFGAEKSLNRTELTL